MKSITLTKDITIGSNHFNAGDVIEWNESNLGVFYFTGKNFKRVGVKNTKYSDGTTVISKLIDEIKKEINKVIEESKEEESKEEESKEEESKE